VRWIFNAPAKNGNRPHREMRFPDNEIVIAMSATTLLESDRRMLFGHRVRGLPAFWIGLIAFLLSLLGLLAQIGGVEPLRKFARGILSAIPPGGSFYREHLHFQFEHAPFATIATLVGMALLIWGAIELNFASRIKRELAFVAGEKRKLQLLQELKAEESPSNAKK
jgi:hypothetical protein